MKLSDRISTGVYEGGWNGAFSRYVLYTIGIIETRYVVFDEAIKVLKIDVDLRTNHKEISADNEFLAFPSTLADDTQ